MRISAFALIVTAMLPAACWGFQVKQESKPVTRAQRPNFSKSDWDGIYFENLFEEGLIGARPEAITPGQLAQDSKPSDAGANGGTTVSNGSPWNGLISRTTLEDEIKALQKQLSVEITTPVRFKSEYLKSHQSFSMLSLLFAVIAQYEGEVRWKEHAAAAQVAFWRAASNSRVGTVQAFESCKSRAELLAEMVRGGKFVGDEKAPDDLDWSNIVDRNPLMHRLQLSLDRLKALSANQGEFTRQSSEALHESELVAAIAFALIQENMTDADDEGYAGHALVMQQAALKAVEGTKSNNYDAVSQAVNGVVQSCDACHADWR